MATNLKKVYKSVVLEIRPRLQSVNVLVNLSCKVNDVKVNLDENNFEMVIDSEVFEISCKNLQIVLNSLSSLVVSDTYISFRFATVSTGWGSFRTELLKTTEAPSRANSENTFLNKSVLYNIKCKTCLQELSEPVQFNRVLPLPSENAEPSDWFCHAHGTDDNIVLSPKESDIFYTFCYCHLNRKIVKNIFESEKLLVCKRCLNWLGQIKRGEIVKFWFNTVVFNLHTTSALEDGFKTLRDVLSSTLFNTAKIILCCQSSKNQVDYVLIWVLEKELRVEIWNSSDEIQDCNVAKVLFKYESTRSEIVTKWMEDQSVISVDISKPMILEMLKHLHKYNKIFPKVFSESNNFYISYLMMYGENK